MRIDAAVSNGLRITTRISPTSGRGSDSPGAMMSVIYSVLYPTTSPGHDRSEGMSGRRESFSQLGAVAETAYRQGLRRTKLENAGTRLEDLKTCCHSLMVDSMGFGEPRKARRGLCRRRVESERGLASIESGKSGLGRSYPRKDGR